MVRNYRLRNRYYKGSKLSEAKFLGLIFPILIGASNASISQEFGLSEFRTRKIAHALRMRLATDPYWMSKIMELLLNRLELVGKKSFFERGPRSLHFAIETQKLCSGHWLAHVFEPNERKKRNETGRDPKLEKKQYEANYRLVSSQEAVEACIHRCPYGLSVAETKNEYGVFDVLALNKAFRTADYEAQWRDPYYQWQADNVIGRCIKRPIQGMQARLENKYKSCSTCPARATHGFSPTEWLLFSSYNAQLKREEYTSNALMGLYFQAAIAPIYFGLYTTMFKICRDLKRREKDDDTAIHNSEWLKTFRDSMLNLETQIVSNTANSLFMQPLENVTGKAD